MGQPGSPWLIGSSSIPNFPDTQGNQGPHELWGQQGDPGSQNSISVGEDKGSPGYDVIKSDQGILGRAHPRILGRIERKGGLREDRLERKE